MKGARFISNAFHFSYTAPYAELENVVEDILFPYVRPIPQR